MEVPKKDNARGTIATNVGLTTTDCNQYSENRKLNAILDHSIER